MQITMAAIEALQERRKYYDTRIAHLQDEISHYYERHGHTNRDWAEDELKIRKAERDEMIAVARILGIDTRKTPATSIAAARSHHAEHGDMDGHTCLLNACALHYPKED